jgi:hypothetical protein
MAKPWMAGAALLLLLAGAALLLLLKDPQAGEQKTANTFVNCKHLAQANCLAGSKIKDEQALGGFGSSDNFPKPVTKEMKIEEGKLQLIAEPESVTSLGKCKGMRLLLVNGTKEQTGFDATNSRLAIVQEAKNAQGKWIPIEYLESSFCGNSYHRVFLGAWEYWEFATPRYKGETKMKLRFALLKAAQPLYSNEFEGSVNPEQFRNEEGPPPGGYVDPYND